MLVFNVFTLIPADALDMQQHILKMFEEESDDEDFLGFPASGMEKDLVLNPVRTCLKCRQITG